MDEHRQGVLTLLGTAGVTPLAGCGFFNDGPETVTGPITGHRLDAYDPIRKATRLSLVLVA